MISLPGGSALTLRLTVSILVRFIRQRKYNQPTPRIPGTCYVVSISLLVRFVVLFFGNFFYIHKNIHLILVLLVKDEKEKKQQQQQHCRFI